MSLRHRDVPTSAVIDLRQRFLHRISVFKLDKVREYFDCIAAACVYPAVACSNDSVFRTVFHVIVTAERHRKYICAALKRYPPLKLVLMGKTGIVYFLFRNVIVINDFSDQKLENHNIERG